MAEVQGLRSLGISITFGLAFVADKAVTKRIDDQVRHEVSKLANQMRDSLDRGMYERWRDIQVVASLDTIRGTSDDDIKRSVLKKVQATFPNYAIVALVDPNGRVVVTSNGLLEGNDVSKREYFSQGRLGPFVGDLHDANLLAKLLPGAGHEPPRFLDVAAPVRRPDGSFGGVIVAHLYWEWARELTQALLSIEQPGKEILIVSNDGTVLLGPGHLMARKIDPSKLNPSKGPDDSKSLPSWDDGTFVTGVSATTGYQEYPGLGWSVVVRENMESAVAPAKQLRKSIFLVSTVAIILTFLFSLIVSRKITQPLHNLTRTANAALQDNSIRFPKIGSYAEAASLSGSLQVLFEERLCRQNELEKAHSDAVEAQEILRAKDQSFRLLLSANPVPMYVFATETLQFLSMNNSALHFYGFSEETYKEFTLLDIRPFEEHDRIRQTVKQLKTTYDATAPWLHVTRHRGVRQVLTSVRRLTYEGVSAGLVAVIDITDRLAAESELRSTKKFLDTVVESMPAMLVVKDAVDRRFVLVNKAAETLLGIPRSELLGKTDHDFFPTEQADGFVATDDAVLASNEVVLIPKESIETAHNGERILSTKKLAVRDEGGEPVFLMSLSDDITEQSRAISQIEHLTYHDTLTGLPNRVLFLDHLHAGLEGLDNEPGNQIAVLLLDLDHFKVTNDTLGHSTGDELIRIIAQRLRGCVREIDMVARFGGDEFGIIQSIGRHDQLLTSVTGLASRIIKAVSEPFEIGGQQIEITTSIGVSVAPADSSMSEELVENADLALYRSKAEGRNTFRFFEAGMDARLAARRSMEADLRLALANDQLEVFYQPIVHIATGEITGVEALLRWRHPKRGMISPAEFIPIAEETKLIIPIGEWVLGQACKEVAAWTGDQRVAVNLSPIQFQFTDVSQMVARALELSGLPVHRLHVEVTETTLLHDSKKTLDCLNALRDMGVRISMDDFGTGYSSLSYLRKYPFNKIKIDQSFIKDLSLDRESQAIIQAVIALATNLGMTTTAEGVETDDQLTLLRLAGCTEAQGYLFSRPKCASEIRAFLAQARPESLSLLN